MQMVLAYQSLVLHVQGGLAGSWSHNIQLVSNGPTFFQTVRACGVQPVGRQPLPGYSALTFRSCQ